MERKTLFKKENWRARSNVLRNEESECLTEEEWLSEEEEIVETGESVESMLAATSLEDATVRRGESKSRGSVVSGLVAKWDRRLMQWSPVLDKIFLYGLDDNSTSARSERLSPNNGGAESSSGGTRKKLSRVFSEDSPVNISAQSRVPRANTPGRLRDSAAGAISKGN